MIGAFERRRYLSVVVERARHPQLRDYINSAVAGLLPFIQRVIFPLSISCSSYLFVIFTKLHQRNLKVCYVDHNRAKEKKRREGKFDVVFQIVNCICFIDCITHDGSF